MDQRPREVQVAHQTLGEVGAVAEHRGQQRVARIVVGEVLGKPAETAVGRYAGHLVPALEPQPGALGVAGPRQGERVGEEGRLHGS